ncbi:hypothetical protein [Defluviimonas salinarum]|uniref:Uncharacterized protein n=1 Tax=Defluviimonas salinarum TaxID=2992147 RepID=A0ABT3J9A6_9RHOB|nr:hypothetical protein [Defluviimonas salinarum]MCW3784274.1 hypothetical protein [Defluviimonas salinarum]
MNHSSHPKRLLLAALIGSLSAVAVVAQESPSCAKYSRPQADLPAHLRFWGNPENIDAYVSAGIQLYLEVEQPLVMPVQANDGSYSNLKLRPYQDVDEFIALNPNCCGVLSSGPDGFAPDPSWQREFGYKGVVIICDPKMIVAESGELRSVPRLIIYAIDRDGAAREFYFD